MDSTHGYFITGTDTGVGKTVVTLGLMQWLQDQGHRVVGMKPVATGCEQTAQGLRNDDAVRLRQQANIDLAYKAVNPVAFEPPIAPHIAAAAAGTRIDLAVLEQGYVDLCGKADRVCVEGVGGWLVPLNKRETVADLAVRLGLDVILVVGIRLGCLNHALLTVQSIETHGARLVGWVANCLPPVVDCLDENINAIKSIVSAPLLGVVPPMALPTSAKIAACLDIVSAN